MEETGTRSETEEAARGYICFRGWADVSHHLIYYIHLSFESHADISQI